MISETAVVETNAIGVGSKIAEFAVVRSEVRLGDNVVIHPHVVIESGVTLGDGVEVFPGAYIGKMPKGAGATSRPLEFRREVSIGAGCSMGPNSIIYQGVSIDENTLIGDGASVREGCVVGQRCIVGMYVTIGYDVEVKSRVKIMDHTHVVGKSLIQDEAFIAMNVGMANDPHIGLRGYREEHIQGVTIGKGAMVGVGANLLPGVVVGERAIVAAGAVVSKDVPAFKVAAGIPAKVVKDIE